MSSLATMLRRSTAASNALLVRLKPNPFPSRRRELLLGAMSTFTSPGKDGDNKIISSLNGNKYVLMFTDGWSRFINYAFIKDRSAATYLPLIDNILECAQAKGESRFPSPCG